MRITQIVATPVSVPLTRVALMSKSAFERTTRTIIEVTTDTGLTGLGETAYGWPAQVIREYLAPRLVGLDPLDRTTARRHCLPAALDFGTPQLAARLAAFGGIEIALWDIAAKSQGLPLYRVLGGACRPRARFSAYAYAPEEADRQQRIAGMVEYATEIVAQTGSDWFEFKVGLGPELDAELVRRLREALPAPVALAVDANMGYSLDDARRFLNRLPRGTLAGLEEPTPDPADWERLNREFGVPISTHLTDLNALARFPGVEGVVPTLDVIGGIGPLTRLAAAATALGKRCWLRSYVELGIGWAAMVHVGMALRELERPAQGLIHTVESDLIEGERWLLRDGGVTPPETPGLGIRLDRQALLRHAAQYEASGDSEVFGPDLRRVS